MATRLLRGNGWVVLVLAGIAVGLTGCNEEQLKQQIVSLETQLRLAEAEKADCQRERDVLASENEKLKGDLATAQDELAKKPKEVIVENKPDFGEGVEVSEDQRGIVVTLPDAILFDSGKTELKSTSKATLDRIAGVIQQDYSGRTIRVEGHTDSDPIRKSKWADNWQLSCERALAVGRYLVGRGIDKKRVYAAGFGDQVPRDTNATAAGKARNRRVEIVITR